MAAPTFIQHSRLGRAIFQINGSDLEITIRQFGRRQERRIPLRGINPDSVHVDRHFPFLVIIPLALTALCGIFIKYILTQDMLPRELITWPVVLIPVFLWQSIRGFPRVHLIVFSDHWNRPLFTIFREDAQRDECDTFVAELVRHIEVALGNLPAEKPKCSPDAESSVRYAAPPTVDLTGVARWKGSLIMGGMSAGLPQIPGVADFLGLWAIPLIIFLSVGGLLLGTLSFLAKEPQRFFGVAGAALSLIAPIFY